ncbi:MAG: putative beta-lysine N-acetyltransferase [Myxococcales bacterium]|nr:putative beta-lysine N-acetyltransferase [Myxococcales bacterium]
MMDLVADIKPAPSKARASLGVVEITLDETSTVKAVGVVYGLEHSISGDGYEAKIFLDQYSQRIRVISYRAQRFDQLILRLRWLAEANGFDKIICMATHGDWQTFLRFGYVLEAVVKYFHSGEDAFVVSKFRSQERLSSPNLMEEILLIERLMAAPAGSSRARPLPPGHVLRAADRRDIPSLIRLYDEIFESYPSPLLHESYLQTVFEEDTLFAVCCVDEKIVAAASAELHHDDRAAELTDCATRPEARGLGLMTHILRHLEGELARREYVCAYTMARARSYGMNNVFWHLGYEFMGRLVNNCDIFGAYEDMNIWVRDLSGRAGQAALR